MRWVVNEKTGKRIPLNPAPVMREGTRFTMSGWNDPDSGAPMVHTVQGAGTGLASHYATCPDSDKWRKPRERADG